MGQKDLENFYETWSSKPPSAIDYDIEALMRKADVIVAQIPATFFQQVRSVIDVGCGYGRLLRRFQERLATTVKVAVGVHVSGAAIQIANQKFQRESLKYFKLPHLDITGNVDSLPSTIPDRVDCILLVDLLEHVPDCKSLVLSLAQFTRFFIVKLPVESSVFDNYLWRKEYPSSVHSNGHLREFDANNVHYFVRQLGFTPLYESLYIYHIDDTCPPLPVDCTFKQKVVRWLIRGFKGVAAHVLPKKIFLRWVGGGGYFCLATFDPTHILNP